MTLKEKMAFALTVKLFGSLREAAENKEIILTFDGSHTTVNDLKQSLYDSCPNLFSRSAHIIVTVNRKVANNFTIVLPDDEVALLPLVSGG